MTNSSILSKECRAVVELWRLLIWSAGIFIFIVGVPYVLGVGQGEEFERYLWCGAGVLVIGCGLWSAGIIRRWRR